MPAIQIIVTPQEPHEEYHQDRGSVHLVAAARDKHVVNRQPDPEDQLLAAAVRARLAGFSKRDAVDLIIDVYSTIWSD